MSDSSPVSIDLQDIALVRKATGMPWLACKEYIGSLSPSDRSKLLTAVEYQTGQLHDPIEDDEEIRPLFLAICDEAVQYTEDWHQQRLAKLEETSPAVAELMRSGRGLCHVRWSKIKVLMKDRHNIDWRMPSEMNPWIWFD